MTKNNDGLIEELRKIFVSYDIFNLRLSPIEKLVYGITAIILTAFASGLVYVVFGRK